MRKLALLTLLIALIPFVAYADTTPTRIANNFPVAGNQFSYNRAFAFGTNSDNLWAFGGGTTNFENDLWRYTYSTNLWTTTGINDLPIAEHFEYATSGNFGNLIIATSDALSDCDTYQYNIDTNTWTTATALAASDCDAGIVGTTANNYYYVLGGTGITNFLRRLDMNNPTGAWTTGLDFPLPYSVPAPGFLVYDRLRDRLVYMVGNQASSAEESVYYYDISTDNWTSLGQIMPCSGTTCPPRMAYWDNALQSVVAVFDATSNDASPMLVYQMDWVTSQTAQFNLVETWTHTDFDYGNATSNRFPVASMTLANGNTRVAFGSGTSTVGAPTVLMERFWTHEQSPIAAPTITIENIDPLWAKIQRGLNGLDVGGTSGQLLFAFISTIALVILAAVVRVSLNIILVLVGVWNGALAFVIDPLQGIVIIGTLVFGLGGVLYLLRLLSGSGGESE